MQNRCRTTEPMSIVQPALLICEGVEDCLILSKCCESWGLKYIQIEHYNGKGNLNKYLDGLQIRRIGTQLKTLLVTRDADDDFRKTFLSVQGFLRANKYHTPSETGVIYGEDLRVGVYLFPNNKDAGAMEDLIIELVRDKPMFACVTQFSKCITKNERNFNSNDSSKSIIHSYLATCERPDLRMGDAFEKGYFSTEHNVLLPLKKFLEEAK